jgi:hypothetical protein
MCFIDDNIEINAVLILHLLVDVLLKHTRSIIDFVILLNLRGSFREHSSSLSGFYLGSQLLLFRLHLQKFFVTYKPLLDNISWRLLDFITRYVFNS